MAKLEKEKKAAEAQKEAEKQKELEELKLPWIPKHMRSQMNDLEDNEKIAYKLIEIIQKHPQYKDGERHSHEILETAA